MSGHKVAELRASRKMSQAELAKLIGTTQQQMARYEKGENDLKASILVKLSGVFKCSVDYILGLDPDPAPQAPAPHNVAAQAESDLLVAFRDLNEEGQRAALAAVRGLAAVYKEQRGEHGRVEEVASQAYAARPFADSWDI